MRVDMTAKLDRKTKLAAFAKSVWRGFRRQSPLNKTLTICALLGGAGVFVSAAGWLIELTVSQAWAEQRKEVSSFLLEEYPDLTDSQVTAFLVALDDAQQKRGFDDAVEAAQRGQTELAQGIWKQIYEDERNAGGIARMNQARAARNLAAATVVKSKAEGLRYYEEAAELDPSHVDTWLGLGDAAMGVGNLSGAREAYEHLIRLATEAGDDVSVAKGNFRLGDVMRRLGQFSSAKDVYNAGLKYQAIFEHQQGLTQNLLAMLHQGKHGLARALGGLGEVRDAKSAFDEALHIIEQVVDSDNVKNDWTHRQFETYVDTGDFYYENGEYRYGEYFYQSALEIAKSFESTYPTSRRWQLNLAKSLRLKASYSDQDEKMELLNASILIIEELVRGDPSDYSIRLYLAESYSNLASWNRYTYVNMCEKVPLEECSEAIRAGLASRKAFRESTLDKSLQVLGGLIDEQPENPMAQESYAKTLRTIGNYEESLGVLRRLVERSPNNFEWRRELADTTCKYAGITREPQLKGKLYSECVSMWETIVDLDKQNINWLRSLANTYSAFAYTELRAAGIESSRESFSAGIALLENGLLSNPSNPFLQFELGMMTLGLARTYDNNWRARPDFHKAADLAEEAEAYYREALGILSPIEGISYPGYKNLEGKSMDSLFPGRVESYTEDIETLLGIRVWIETDDEV